MGELGEIHDEHDKYAAEKRKAPKARGQGHAHSDAHLNPYVRQAYDSNTLVSCFILMILSCCGTR